MIIQNIIELVENELKLFIVTYRLSLTTFFSDLLVTLPVFEKVFGELDSVHHVLKSMQNFRKRFFQRFHVTHVYLILFFIHKALRTIQFLGNIVIVNTLLSNVFFTLNLQIDILVQTVTVFFLFITLTLFLSFLFEDLFFLFL